MSLPLFYARHTRPAQKYHKKSSTIRRVRITYSQGDAHLRQSAMLRAAKAASLLPAWWRDNLGNDRTATNNR
jgi:hypothetical protein